MIIVFDIGGSKIESGIFTYDGKLFQVTTIDREDENNVFNQLTNYLDNNKTLVIEYVVIGMAGISRFDTTIIQSFKQQCYKNFPNIKKVELLTDVELLFELIEPNSLAVSIGTGSILVYKSETSEKKYFGGWGYLFDDYLSGWWWFQQFFIVAMTELEERSDQIGILNYFNKICGVDAERRALIHWAYQTDRKKLSLIASNLLKEFQQEKWVIDAATHGVQKMFLGINHLSINKIYIQGGLILNHEPVLQSFKTECKIHYPKVIISAVPSLLRGGFFYWKRQNMS